MLTHVSETGQTVSLCMGQTEHAAAQSGLGRPLFITRARKQMWSGFISTHIPLRFISPAITDCHYTGEVRAVNFSCPPQSTHRKPGACFEMFQISVAKNLTSCIHVLLKPAHLVSKMSLRRVLESEAWVSTVFCFYAYFISSHFSPFSLVSGVRQHDSVAHAKLLSRVRFSCRLS